MDNSHLVAHCVATLPLRCRINAGLRASRNFLKQLRTSVLDAHGHSNVTFGSLISKLQIDRDPSRPPLVSVVFNIDKIGATFDFGDLTVSVWRHPSASSPSISTSMSSTRVPSLLIEFDYNTDLLEPDTIRRWLGHFEVLLREIVRDPEQSVARIDILGAEERQRLRGRSREG